MPPDRSTVLVTGVTGFVGRHLAPVLAALGLRVRGAARHVPPQGRSGVSEWRTVDSVGPDTDWAEALRGVSVVVHLAALAHQTDPHRQSAESEYMAVNAQGTRQLAAAAARSGTVRRIIFVSSVGAVTDACNSVIEESSIPVPVSAYGRSKLAGETALQETLLGSAVEWGILRPVLVYGPGNPGNMARLLRLVRSGLPLPLGGIRNRRSFVFVGNLVGAIGRLVVAPGVSGRVFHVADDESVSTPELIRLIAAAAGCPARLWAAPPWSLRLAARGGDAVARVGVRTGLDSYSLRRLEESLTVSNQALRHATGWEPQASLTEGLRLTLRADLPGQALNA